MKEPSCSKRITEYLERCNTWISGDLLERKVQQAGYKASTGSRCARKLAEDGKIQRKEDRKGYVWYAPLTAEKPKQYKTIYQPIVKDGRTVMTPVQIEV